MRNLSFAKENQTLNEPYNKTSVLSWHLPCRQNGKIEKFIVKYFEEASPGNSQMYEVIAVDGQENYIFTSDEFLPEIKYNAAVFPVGEFFNGSETSRTFEILPGCECKKHIKVSKSF